eukprot:1498318-Prymnesium_polylepis.1
MLRQTRNSYNFTYRAEGAGHTSRGQRPLTRSTRCALTQDTTEKQANTTRAAEHSRGTTLARQT